MPKFPFKVHRGRGQDFPINISCRCLVDWARKIAADFREGDEDSNFNFSIFRVRRFSEWPEPLHWIAIPVELLTKALIHWIASPPFSLKKTFFSLKSAALHPLPKNRLLENWVYWWYGGVLWACITAWCPRIVMPSNCSEVFVWASGFMSLLEP